MPDQLAPDPDQAERAEHAARHLSWTGISGGLSFQGFLPTLEGAAFKAAIEATAESLRVSGDKVRVGKRRRADTPTKTAPRSTRTPPLWVIPQNEHSRAPATARYRCGLHGAD